jgi:hypothetical protein
MIQSPYLHKAQFISAAQTFSAVYNAITPGRYDFTNTAACQNVQLIELLRGTVYWIKTVSVGGNLSEQDYLGSIVTVPQMRVGRLVKPDAVYRFPLTLGKFAESADASAWVFADIGGDVLTLSMSGLCQQLPAMIGLGTMTLVVSIHIFAFNDAKFSAEFKRGIGC